ncbi:hypothetical protein OG762_05375 [Streptomyces sp. NBC_01136]|uniref:hypothetical protein n=1 Tax=unclassified Streptomyces TaxID=2593676 RepID=UPI0032461FE7|nr:hypothetical protein OG762_05375 [Streptomyces sp. NBC_01136]
MEPPVIAAFIVSTVAIATNAGGWVVSIRQTHRNARVEQRQWRRETRRDAYADLVTSFQEIQRIYTETPATKGLEEDADEYITPDMAAALRDLYLKAVAVRFEGPSVMRDLAVETVECGHRFAAAWVDGYTNDEPKRPFRFDEETERMLKQRAFPPFDLDEELTRAVELQERIIAEAEKVLLSESDR